MIPTFPFHWQVLVTNQLTTKVGPANESRLVPALGDSFGHYSSQRLMLGCLQRECYAAVLFKSVRRKQSSAKFQVICTGVCCLWHVIRNSCASQCPIFCAIYCNFRYWRVVFEIAVHRWSVIPIKYYSLMSMAVAGLSCFVFITSISKWCTRKENNTIINFSCIKLLNKNTGLVSI
jgi:hypothetical protein